MEDRRKFPRKEIRLNVVCVFANGCKERVSARSTDISFGGIGLSFNRPIGDEKRIIMIIHEPSLVKGIEAKGRIIWRADPDRNGNYRAGVEFTEIPWTQIKHLLA